MVGYGRPEDPIGWFTRRYGDFTVSHVAASANLEAFSLKPSVEGLHIRSGDSGGPVFVGEDEFELVGVNSTLIHGTAWAANVTAQETADWLAETIAEFQPDSDGDGIPDACDTCPSSPNHLDSDGDLVPDDCDPCPCTAEGEDDDSDLDSVCDSCEPGLSDYCGSYCESAPVDNCPTVTAPTQANCNFDAEQAREAEVLGDLCDPVPCPRGKPKFKASHTTWNHAGPVHTSFTTIELDRFVIDKVIPKDVTGPIKPFGTTTEAADYRYCNEAMSPDFNCLENSEAIIDDSLLWTKPDAASEGPGDPWRRVKIAGLGLDERDLADDARYYDLCGTAPKNLPDPCLGEYYRVWDFDADLARWGLSVGPLPGASMPIGRFWFHTESPLGTSDPEPGVHMKADISGPADSLTNHYEALAPRRTVTTTYVEGNPWHPFIWVLHCPQCGDVARPWDQLLGEIFLVGSMGPGFEHRYGSLTGNGTQEDISDQLGPGLIASLDDASLTWVRPVEPNTMMGRGSTLPLALALSADGTRVVDRIRSDGERLVGDRDRPVEEVVRTLVTPFSSETQQVVPPRSDFVAVMSRVRNGVFVVGGNEPGTGEPRADAWFMNLSSGTWVPVRMHDYRPEHVLAATYAYGDERMWILDEDRTGWFWKRRLARVDVDDGTVDIVGEWPTLRVFDRHWLQVDRDGAVILAASSRALRKHVLVRLVADGSVRVGGLHMGQWDLIVPPGVDMQGITLVKHPHRHKGPRVQRLSAFGHGGRWSSLRGCLR